MTQLIFGDQCLFLLSCQSEVLNQEVASTEQTLKSSNVEVKEVKTQLQALEIELQSQLSMVRQQR